MSGQALKALGLRGVDILSTCRCAAQGTRAEPASFLPLRGLGDERGGELLVEGEEVFHALAVGAEGLLAVAAVHRAVELLVGLRQLRRHRDRIVEIRQRAAGELLPRVQYRLRRFFDFGLMTAINHYSQADRSNRRAFQQTRRVAALPVVPIFVPALKE